jgi:hypothetical protein
MSLSTFHAFNFLRDTDGENELVLRNTADGDLSWTGTLGNDDVVASVKAATADMITTDDKGPYRTAYGVLESVE